jgi:hypothetical protein
VGSKAGSVMGNGEGDAAISKLRSRLASRGARGFLGMQK